LATTAPTATTDTDTTPPNYRALLARYLAPQAGRAAILSVLLCASIALQLINPQIISAFIDATTGRSKGANLTAIAVLFIVVALAQQALSVAATYVSELVGWTATNALRGDLALHCLRLDLSFHKARTPGELIERIDGDVTALANFFSQFIIQVVGSLLLLLGVLVVLWRVDWRVGAALTAFAAIVLAGMTMVRTLATPYWQADREASAALFGFLEERLAGTVDIRANGAQLYIMRRLYAYLRARLRAASKARLVGTVTWSVPTLGFALGNALAFVLAAYLFKAASITLGTAFLIYYYTQLLFHPLNLISSQLEDFQKASAGIIRIRELLGIRSALVDGPGVPLALPAGPLSVDFEDVAFGYEDGDIVAHNLSFRIAPGKVLGLLGRTGSGKTTITRLLLRLYDPVVGTIRLGGVDLRAARRADVRRHIGMVTQDVQLFRATVRDNLTFFDATVDDARILHGLAELGLMEWFRGLSNGLDTMVAAGGAGLSAGEAQLLAFTRVFLKDPGLIILDEASSRLDPATERLIERAVDRLLEGRTGIIIAHRLATVRRADEILILDGGRIGEHGARETLARDPRSRFAGLLRTGVEEVLV
jgi:ABC-type multidrug transport system fused ATPase/permease subunit